MIVKWSWRKKIAGSRVSRRYVNFADEKVIVARRNVIWKASITLGLG